MSVSTDGILFYGFIEMDESNWLEYEDQSKHLEQYGEYKHDTIFREKFQSSNILLGRHCSDSYPLHYLAIKSTNIEASRGHPRTLDLSAMIIQPEWEQQLRDCAKEMGFKLGTQEPSWWLASYWG